MQSKRKVHMLESGTYVAPISGIHKKTVCGMWMQMNYVPDLMATSRTWGDVTCKRCLKKRSEME